MTKVLIAGGTGFVGNALIQYLLQYGYTLHVLTRKSKMPNNNRVKYFYWDTEKGIIDERAFEGVTKIINLTGINIAEKRWTKQRKIEIVESRVKPITLLYNSVKKQNINIKSFISSSAVGYYGSDTSSEIFTETSANGKDFMASVCAQWENAAHQFENLGTATVILRKGAVLGRAGGMLQKLSPLAKMGIPVAPGSGKQFVPWVALEDLVRLYEFILCQDKFNGVFNIISPQHTRFNDLSKALLQSFGKKSFLPNPPAFLLQLLYGEMAEMLLGGSRVSNEKISKAGFCFEVDSIEKLLSNEL